MSIATAIQNAQGKVADAYTTVSNKGGTLPATQDLSNLPTAISSISTSSGSVVVKDFSSSQPVLLFSGTSYGIPSSALNYSGDVTLTTGTYTLWYETSGSHVLVATINL